MRLSAIVTIGVFRLFHSHAFDIEPSGSSRLELNCGTAFHRTLEGNTRVRLTSDCTASGPRGEAADFVLIVPGGLGGQALGGQALGGQAKIRRHYQGTLKTTRQPDGELIAAVTMALETAVASTVAAESPPDAGVAMLEAQAIVTRSYFGAGRGRHSGFDFCDTTHCQFLKDPPPPTHPAYQAAQATAGRLLLYRDRPFAPFYAARCDGLLAPLPPEKIGEGDYPYFAVKCDYCLRHPSKVALKANARPHHHGMCQLGAADLARQGWTAAEILTHYYPGAEVR